MSRQPDISDPNRRSFSCRLGQTGNVRQIDPFINPVPDPVFAGIGNFHPRDRAAGTRSQFARLAAGERRMRWLDIRPLPGHARTTRRRRQRSVTPPIDRGVLATLFASRILRIELTSVVLPTPGPPVTTGTFEV